MFYASRYQVEILNDNLAFKNAPDLKEVYDEYCYKKEQESLDYLCKNWTIGNFKLIEWFLSVIEKFYDCTLKDAIEFDNILKKHFSKTENIFGWDITVPDNSDDEVKFLIRINKNSTDTIINGLLEEALEVTFNINDEIALKSTISRFPTFYFKWIYYLDHRSFIQQLHADLKNSSSNNLS